MRIQDVESGMTIQGCSFRDEQEINFSTGKAPIALVKDRSGHFFACPGACLLAPKSRGKKH
jgi:hypothetical protein